MVYLNVGSIRLIGREKLVLFEIGADEIDSASGFVDYMSDAYGFSKSSVWYNLNRLREKGLLGFSTKENPGCRLALTHEGKTLLSRISHEKGTIVGSFSRVYMERAVLGGI